MKNLKNNYEGKILNNENLSKYNWFNLGGPAKIFFKPSSIIDLANFLKDLKEKEIHVLGAGSNTLIRDGGINGITIPSAIISSTIIIFKR